MKILSTYVLYGRDPKLPSESILEAPKDRRMTSLVDYKELTTKLNDAWQFAQEQIKKSQASRKQYYDTFANEHGICVGDRVYVYTPAKKLGLLTNLHVHLWVPTGC